MRNSRKERAQATENKAELWKQSVIKCGLGFVRRFKG